MAREPGRTPQLRALVDMIRILVQISLAASMTAIAGCVDGANSGNQASCSASPPAYNSYVDIPSGSFVKGAAPIYSEEEPTITVHVDGFSILTHEVTNDQFAKFVAATGYITDAENSMHRGGPGAGSAVFTMPSETTQIAGDWKLIAGATWRAPNGPGSNIKKMGSYPVVHISHADAKAYAIWAGGRLPSEIEWEYAATLGLNDSKNATSNAYAPTGKPIANTWQGIFPIIDQARDGFSGPSPVGCFTADKAGLYDMIGNVWEWTDTPYGSATHTVKGGSYLCSENFCMRYRPAARQPQETDFSSNHIGFRIIKN